MKREIKFRAWDSKKERMFPVYGLGNDFVTEDTIDGVDPGHNAFTGEELKERIILMQYTGLKDKNGKEIYEGDIVENEFGKKLVEWRDGGFVYLERFMTIFLQHEEVSKLEVIGNIYENKELIE